MNRFTTITFAVAVIVALSTTQVFAQATLNNAATWFRFDSTNDSNGPDVTGLDGVHGGGGLPTVGNAEVVGGPGSNNQVAEFFGINGGGQTSGGYFRANPGDGAGTPGELEMDSSFSIYTRVNFDETKLMYLYSKFEHKSGSSDQRLTYLRHQQDGSLQFTVGDGAESVSAVDTTVSLTPGTWYDIAASFDDAGDTGSVYVFDPVTRALIDSATSALPDSPNETDDPFLIGARENFGVAFEDDFVNGRMEMMAVWSGTVYSQSDFENLTVPEPGSSAILITGLLLMCGCLRRRR